MNALLFLLALVALVLLGLAWFTHRTARRIEQYLPAKGQFVEVPGGRRHVRLHDGAGPAAPAVLLGHGLGGQMSHF
jgi:hypothetical protein